MIDGVTTNDEQRLFVIRAGKGFSCFGYDNCYRESKQLAERLERPDLMPREDEIGTLKQYGNHRELLRSIGDRDLGTWYSPGTPIVVQSWLEGALKSKVRLKLTYGDPETGAVWGDRPETGTIGRSMGPLKVPLLIKNRRSTGGAAILTNCIVGIECEGKVMYRHKDYHVPEEATAPAP